MTPTPPSSPDGSSLPPRHRPNLSSLSKDTTEQDLWAFDDLQPLEEEESSSGSTAQSGPFSRPAKKTTPPRRKAPESAAGDEDSPGKTAASNAAAESIKVNVGRNRPIIPSGGASGHAGHGSDFDDLDHWEESQDDYALPAAAPPLVTMPVATETETAPTPVAGRSSAPAPEIAEDDEFSIPVRNDVPPVSLRPHLGLSKMERVGLIALVVVLVICGGVAFFNTIRRLPTGAEKVVANDFPVKGEHLSIQSAETFWRSPISGTGPGADTFRRGTVLLPEVVLKPEGGPAAIRVFFRNGDREYVGDAVTRSIKTAAEIRVAATAGFDDIGMHAAYRTGQTKPWTVEVREAPSEDSPVKDFKKLFEMNISTDRR